MRVALYARVSTRDKDQNSESQLVLLHREIVRAGDTLSREYIDQALGGQASRRQLLRDAERRQFELVRVLALDRFSSEGTEAMSARAARFDQCGVACWSYCEPLLSTTGPLAAFCQAGTAWAAGYRAQRHGENVRLGQARQRAQVVAQVRALAATGRRRRQVAAASGALVGTVHHPAAAD